MRARTRDASLDVRKFASEKEKKRRPQCRVVASRFLRVERGHIRQKVSILTNLVAMATKRARGGWVALDVSPAAARQTCTSAASVEAQGFGCCTYFGVSGEQLEGLVHLPLFDASAEVQEVGRLPSVQVDDVTRGHGQTGSVHWDERTSTG